MRAPAWQLHVFIFVISFFLIISRRPDLLLNAQFCQEDGRTWYMDAYRLGLKAFIIPCNGTLVTLPRLVAGAVQGLPLIAAPTIYNLVAAVCHVLPVSLLFTTRMRDALPCPWTRWVLALSFSACRVPSRFMGWRIDDLLVVLISGLSGPCCVALLPLGLIRWAFYTRTESGRKEDPADTRWLLTLCCLIAICAVVQAAMLFHLDLLGGKVLFAYLLGDEHWFKLISSGSGLSSAFYISLTFSLLGVFVLMRSLLWNSPSGLRVPLFVIFTGYIFIATLAYPLPNTEPAWEVWLFTHAAGNRCWFVPMIGFFMALVTAAAHDRKRIVRAIAFALLVLAPIGAISEWCFKPWPDLGLTAPRSTLIKLRLELQ